MKRLFPLLFLILFGCKEKDTGMVYICKYGDPTTFHKNKKCPSLLNCDGDILWIPFTQKNQGHEDEYGEEVNRQECGLCYGK